MGKKRRRGISFGTVFMLLLTVAVLGASAVLVPRLAGHMDQRVDAQQLANAITSSLDLPELSLSDIPIFPHTDTAAEATAVPPGNAAAQNVQETQAGIGTPAPQATLPPSQRSFTLTAAGTVAFDTNIRKAAYHKESGTYDYTRSFSMIGGLLDSDLCLATLENTLVDGAKLNDLNVTGDVLAALTSAGLDMLSLGHERILDLGLDGLVKTAAAVKNAGFTALGVHADRQETQNAFITDIQGVRVAFLHYTDAVSSAGKKTIKNENCAYALPVYQADVMKADIQAARGQGVQVVIVLMHWGADNQGKPTRNQQEQAQVIADAGADILLGAHSNVVQPMVYLTGNRPDGSKRPTLVCYSLGTLLTGSREAENIAGMLLRLKITIDPASGVVAFDQVQYTPTYVWRRQADGQVSYVAVASDQTPPDDMDDSQRKVMVRALDRITKLLADSPAKPRSAGN